MRGSIPEKLLSLLSITNHLLQGFMGKVNHFWCCNGNKILSRTVKYNSAGDLKDLAVLTLLNNFLIRYSDFLRFWL